MSRLAVVELLGPLPPTRLTHRSLPASLRSFGAGIFSFL
jgi:hypothetical protein